MGIGSLLLKRSLICAGRETMAAPSSSKYKVVVGYVSFLLMFFLSRQPPCSAVYSISYSEPLLYNQTLVSPNHIFELGFFTPHGTSNQYVGMWFKNLTPTKVVWVANRDRPLRSDDRFACLTIGSDGNMRLVDGHQNTVWSTDVPVERSNGYTAALLDTGNLVLRSDGDTGTSIWESFDHPTDTLLAEMKIGINVKTGEKRYLTSWKTDTDPSPGMVSLGLTAEVPTQPFIWNGSAPLWRGGQWDQSKFIGVSTMDGRYLNGHIVQQDVLKGTTYFSYELPGSYIGYLFVSHGGSMKFLMWNPISQNWIPIWGEPHDPCEAYGTCGPFGICRIRSGFSSCDCVRGFAPKSEEEWKRGNWRGGCVRKHGLHCVAGPAGITDRFWKVSRLKLPDRSIYLRDVSTKTECEGWCLRNCSCVAYSFVEAIGCMVWTGELMDIKDFNGTGEDLFLRLARRKRGETHQRYIYPRPSVCNSQPFFFFFFSAVLFQTPKRRLLSA
ncbi:hypothetical protein SAY87_022041 [Trapa incisa]|uniref:Uncharacterized protein n=1 Tax=Trapa incisa TaxID=236973 RepID=A0AAN7PT80_9MYRT|nr:hypothetical protein SAY87_022041 [Trapa incisa]